MEGKFKFIDIRSHILPEIVDGARDFEELPLIMAEMKDAGGQGVVMTPLITTDGSETKILDKIAHRFDVLNKLAFKTGIAMDLYLGAEIMLLPELPQKIKEDKRPGTYIGKRYGTAWHCKVFFARCVLVSSEDGRKNKSSWNRFFNSL